MKFIHEISKITSYIIQICLLVAVLASNSLWGEVYHAGQVSFTSKGEHHVSFTKILKNFDKQYLKVKRSFKKTNDTQMPGCAVFIPEGENKGQLYIAQKRKGPSTTFHNPALGGNPFYVNYIDHTERQLALYLAAEALGVDVANTKIKFRVEEGKVAPHEKIKGEFHIYTIDAPCVDAVDDNNNFSCIKYYQTLREQHPRCKFHVYFPTIKLNGTFFVKNTNKEYLEKLKNLIRPCSKDYLSIFDKIDPATKEQIKNYLKKNKPGKYELIDILNKPGLNEYKTAIFKELFKIEGVEYHLMPPTKKA